MSDKMTDKLEDLIESATERAHRTRRGNNAPISDEMSRLMT